MKDLAVPRYLSDTYWWAYVHPRAVRFFDRPWLINLILWGNYVRLRDAALQALGERLPGRTLQVACVYGDITQRMRERLTPSGSLDVVDVVRAQLDNLARKLNGGPRVGLLHGDSSALDIADATYDRVLLFFLLHEQPGEVRRRTITEALRVLKPGGRLVILDYHRPRPWHPLYWPMVAVLKLLEPFALDLWQRDLVEWLPAGVASCIDKRTYFGGLYQVVQISAAHHPHARGVGGLGGLRRRRMKAIVLALRERNAGRGEQRGSQVSPLRLRLMHEGKMLARRGYPAGYRLHVGLAIGPCRRAT